MESKTLAQEVLGFSKIVIPGTMEAFLKDLLETSDENEIAERLVSACLANYLEPQKFINSLETFLEKERKQNEQI